MVDISNPLGAVVLYGTGMVGGNDCDAGYDGGTRGFRVDAPGEKVEVALSLLDNLYVCDGLCFYNNDVLLVAGS